MLEVHGQNLVDEFVRDDYKDSVTEILKNVLKGIERANFEFPLLTSGDHVVEVLLNATSWRNTQDNVIGVVGIGQDITDARAKLDAEMKQQAAEAATAAQATISAHVYHECAQPCFPNSTISIPRTMPKPLQVLTVDGGMRIA